MKTLLTYIIVFFIIILLFFIDKQEKEPFTPLTGVLYSISTATQTTQSSPVTDIFIYKKSLVSDDVKPIPIKTASSKPSLLNKLFSPKPTKPESSDIVPDLKPPISTPEKSPVKVWESEPKKPQKVEINFIYLNNIIKNSDKTYYFSTSPMTKGDVTLKVYSLTPYDQKCVLKFQVTNSQQKYFFISNVAVYEGKNLIKSELFYDPLVGPEKTLECIALMAEQKNKTLTIKVTESGGSGRKLEVSFKTP